MKNQLKEIRRQIEKQLGCQSAKTQYAFYGHKINSMAQQDARFMSDDAVLPFRAFWLKILCLIYWYTQLAIKIDGKNTFTHTADESWAIRGWGLAIIFHCFVSQQPWEKARRRIRPKQKASKVANDEPEKKARAKEKRGKFFSMRERERNSWKCLTEREANFCDIYLLCQEQGEKREKLRTVCCELGELQ